MSLFQFRWLRKLIRKNTNPIPGDKAAWWKRRLSIFYAIFAWHAFGFVLYNIGTGKADWPKYYNLKSEEELKMSPAQQWTKTLGIEKATVYRISGTKYSKYNIENEFPDDERKSK